MTFREFFADKHPDIGSDVSPWAMEFETPAQAFNRLADTLADFADRVAACATERERERERERRSRGMRERCPGCAVLTSSAPNYCPECARKFRAYERAAEIAGTRNLTWDEVDRIIAAA